MTKTLVFLRTENNEVFDGSVKGAFVKLSGDVKPARVENTFSVKKGFIELGNLPELQQSEAFTFEATVTPAAIGPNRQNIIESQAPPAAFFINPQGFIVGSVNTSAGWQGLQSSEPLHPGKAANIRFTRNEQGQMDLEINGKNVGSKQVNQKLVPVGNLPIKVGTWVDGQGFQFTGNIANVQIRKGALTANEWNTRVANAKTLEQSIKTKIGLNVSVKVIPSLDESHSRLQPIKDIMNAAGVDKLSDLATLRITVPTKMIRGKVLLASRKNDMSTIDWSKIAANFTSFDVVKKKEHLAKFFPNRNSEGVIKNAQADTATPISRPTGPIIGKLESPADITSLPGTNPRNIEALKRSVDLSKFVKIQDPVLK